MAKTPEEIARERDADMKALSKRGFADWLELPEVKLLLSMISPTVNAPPELLTVLMESAFLRGVAVGESCMVTTLMRRFSPESRG